MDGSPADTAIRLPERPADRLPHIEMLPHHETTSRPSAGGGPADPLAVFVSSGRPWTRAPVAVARRTTVALWLLAAIGIGGCIALVTVLRHQNGCRSLPCSVATFGGHPLIVLLLAASGTAVLLTMAVGTRGLTRLSARQLWLVVPAAGLTFGSVAGLLAVFVVTVLIVLATILGTLLIFTFLADHA